MRRTAVVRVVFLLLLLAPLNGFSFVEYEKSKCASFVFRGTIKTFCSQDPLDPHEEEMLAKTLNHMVRRTGAPDKSDIEIKRSPQLIEVHIRFFDDLDGNTTYATGRGNDFRAALKNLTVLPTHNE